MGAVARRGRESRRRHRRYAWTGRKMTVRIQSQALEALRSIKGRYADAEIVSGQGGNARVISSAILFFEAAQAVHGLKFDMGILVPNTPAEAAAEAKARAEAADFEQRKARERHEPIYLSKPKTSRSATAPALRLV